MDEFDEFLRSLDGAATDVPTDDVLDIEQVLNGEGEVPVRFVGGPLHGEETKLPLELDSLYPVENLSIAIPLPDNPIRRANCYKRFPNRGDDTALFLYIFDFEGTTQYEPTQEEA